MMNVCRGGSKSILLNWLSCDGVAAIDVYVLPLYVLDVGANNFVMFVCCSHIIIFHWFGVMLFCIFRSPRGPLQMLRIWVIPQTVKVALLVCVQMLSIFGGAPRTRLIVLARQRRHIIPVLRCLGDALIQLRAGALLIHRLIAVQLVHLVDVATVHPSLGHLPCLSLLSEDGRIQSWLTRSHHPLLIQLINQLVDRVHCDAGGGRLALHDFGLRLVGAGSGILIERFNYLYVSLSIWNCAIRGDFFHWLVYILVGAGSGRLGEIFCQVLIQISDRLCETLRIALPSCYCVLQVIVAGTGRNLPFLAHLFASIEFDVGPVCEELRHIVLVLTRVGSLPHVQR